MTDRQRLPTATRRELIIGMSMAPLGLTACGHPPEKPITPDAPWPQVLDDARGQRVNWAAWAGDQKIDAYIGWVAETVRGRFGITLTQIKVGETANTIQRLLADKSAQRVSGGLTDLIWINGENFVAAKEAGLLWGPFAHRLPNWRFVDAKDKPSITTDFTVPNQGYESPWGMAQLTFFYDSASGIKPPRTMSQFLSWARAHPGRFTYPAPPDFVGITFVKQALYGTIVDRSLLAEPVVARAFVDVTATHWAYLDALNTMLWRRGRAFPPDYPSVRQLLGDREVDIAIAFNPSEAATSVAAGILPVTTRAYVLDSGAIQNTHFVAIPFNASAKAAALVVADFLLSPEAQARKADPRLWGDPTVLDIAALEPTDRARFEELPGSAQLPEAAALSHALPEPHFSWHLKLSEAWRARYAA